jgi:hypothetical protein
MHMRRGSIFSFLESQLGETLETGLCRVCSDGFIRIRRFTLTSRDNARVLATCGGPFAYESLPEWRGKTLEVETC